MKIGNGNCNASACADDVALMSIREHETQVMINIAHEFATMEGYKLQPAKSVIINIQPNKRKQSMMDQEYILENNVVPMTKRMWITSIKREIQNYWQKLITSIASYYPRLKYLNSADYRPGNIHPLLKIKCSSSIEISGIPPKLKMLTGTYILQTIRTKMYADEDAKCQLCKVETETLEHLLLDCTELSNIRNPILRQIQDIFLHHTEYDLCQQSTSVQMQILLDITRISKVLRLTDDQIRQIEYHIRRLIYAFHSERYKILNIHWKLEKSNKKNPALLMYSHHHY